MFANPARMQEADRLSSHQGLGPGRERVYRYVICVFVSPMSPFFKFLVQFVLITGRHVFSVVNQACFTNTQLSYEVHDVFRDIAIRGSLKLLSNKHTNLLYRHERSTIASSGVLLSRSPRCSGMIWCYP